MNKKNADITEVDPKQYYQSETFAKKASLTNAELEK
jgi:hypothetical protein